MTHDQASKLLARFEENHAVDTYTMLGVHVWPLIRMFLGLRLIMQGGDPERPSLHEREGWGRMIRRIRGIALRVFRYLRNLYRYFAAGFPSSLQRQNQWPSVDGGFPVAILTNADRPFRWGDSWLHPVVDPLADLLERRGRRLCIWELGRSPGPRVRPPQSVRELHKHKYNLASKRLPITLRRPGWFEEINEFMIQDCGLKIAWHEFEATIRHVVVLAEVLGEWMDEAGCRIVFLDCWFTAHSLAASLAARRRGIPSVDFQHGTHGEANVGYNRWVRAPEGGYAIMPRYFWVWGQYEANALLEDNHPAVAHAGNVLVGGNLWINRWRRSDEPQTQRYAGQAAELCSGFSRVILVTLQTPVVPYPDWLVPAIRDSPKDWRWLIRVHRRDAVGRERLDREFGQAGHPGVELEQASSLPLYALLQRADAHVTGYSTCAVEALAFGLRSILTHPTADSMQRRYLEQGAMIRCDDAATLINLIREPSKPMTEEVRAGLEIAFASDEAAVATMERLESLAGITWAGKTETSSGW